MANKGSAAKITSSSTAEYFSKNLQQVGFSSQTKAVLTTLKEAVDNALDACEEHHILPEVWVEVEKVGKGSLKNADQIRVKVSDNGPGIEADDLPKVFGEYLASSKFGRGRCSRGQQGIGISAATTWAQLTSATGARVISKTKNMRKAVSCIVEVDIRSNKGAVRDRETIDWDRPHGTSVEFLFDGRIQLNGEAGIVNYLNGNVLVNPHLTLHYRLPEIPPQDIERVSQDVPGIPSATEPHPHTMKLGEFIAHSHLFGRMKAAAWLRKGFSRVSDGVLAEMRASKVVSSKVLEKNVDSLTDAEFKDLYAGLQASALKAPSTQSVLAIGEEGLAKSIRRLGDVDFFSVVSRRPVICDFKPVQVEVAVARLKERTTEISQTPVQVLRFANRVPLQFDKSGCAIVQSINSVNWRAYGIEQPKGALPIGPYIVAVSVVSPFIKFKNASKETVDGSDELVEEIRRALMQAGQKLSRHIRSENKAQELEQKIRHIEQFGPILVDGLCRITHAPQERKEKATAGLLKLLGREARAAEAELKDAHAKAREQAAKDHALVKGQESPDSEAVNEALGDVETVPEISPSVKPANAKAAKSKKKRGKKASEEDDKQLKLL